MARPKKQTVDYFPHMATSGKTMFILESQFGNDGYAFWFKLLEMLATTNGHFINCRNSADWQFLLAKTRVDEVTASRILDLLASLDAIDKELWEVKVIWSQNFVNNISDVYKNRKTGLPKKPDKNSFYEQKSEHNGISTSRNSNNEEFSAQPTDKNPQSKVKESKVNKTKVNNTNNPNKITSETETLAKFIEKEFGYFLSGSHIETIKNWQNDFSEELIKHAVTIAVLNNKKSFGYVNGILLDWQRNNIKTLEEVKRAEEEFRKSKLKKNSNRIGSNVYETIRDLDDLVE